MYVMRRVLVAAVTVLIAMASGGMGFAQSVPAEIPSANFRGDQYVDSRGCAFVRVGLGSNTQWVPRVGRDRRHICGLTPSGAGASTSQAAVAPQRPAAGVTMIGAAPRPTIAVSGPTAIAPAASAATAPAASAAPTLRQIGSTARPPASQPRNIGAVPRAVTPSAPTTACPNLPADIRGYFTGANVRCGPQARHPGDAARGIDRTSALGGAATAAPQEPRQLVRYVVNPPKGYRAAWDDGRLNPYRGLGFANGQRQMEQIWTNSLPRRLVGGAEVRGLRGLTARDAGPATLVPAQLAIMRP